MRYRIIARPWNVSTCVVTDGTFTGRVGETVQAAPSHQVHPDAAGHGDEFPGNAES